LSFRDIPNASSSLRGRGPPGQLHNQNNHPNPQNDQQAELQRLRNEYHEPEQHGLEDDGRHLEKRKGSFRLSFQRKGRQGRNRNNNNTLVASFSVGHYSHPSSPQQQQR
jgi:hypothetical protein